MPSQVWTWIFARLLADGIADLIRFEFDASRNSSSFPATGGRPALAKSVDPSEVVPDDPRLKWRCRACRNGVGKNDPRHTREADECKFPLGDLRITNVRPASSDLWLPIHDTHMSQVSVDGPIRK